MHQTYIKIRNHPKIIDFRSHHGGRVSRGNALGGKFTRTINPHKASAINHHSQQAYRF